MADLPPVAGMKRRSSESASTQAAPSLLPAFEPESSSPTLPRPAKRVARHSPLKDSSPRSLFGGSPRRRGHHQPLQDLKYPTPVPTSSTGVMSSSPPLPRARTRRPAPKRTLSNLSERAPLSTVPFVTLNPDGEPTFMGRSGKSSQYQLSTNKLVSRVHVRAAYLPADPPTPGRVEIVCLGWNGLKVHCQGKIWELAKEDSFTTESRDMQIMLDVADARVMIRWPKVSRKATTPETDSNPDTENNGNNVLGAGGAVHQSPFPSPARMRVRLHSPISPTPTPAGTGTGAGSRPMGLGLAESSLDIGHNTSSRHSPPLVQIYEDEPEDDTAPSQPLGPTTQPTQSTFILTQPEPEEFSDHDEENDPVVHSFGPFGENLLPRMAAVTAGDSSPLRRRNRTHSQHQQQLLLPLSSEFGAETVSIILNHVVNQLAYSRLSSTPLSVLYGNLPENLREGTSALISGTSPSSADAEKGKEISKDQVFLSTDALKQLMNQTPCIGQVARAGKDAAGKPLESEYYYVPENDFDAQRRDAVVEGLRKPGLRSCRKMHKPRVMRRHRAHKLIAILLAQAEMKSAASSNC